MTFAHSSLADKPRVKEERYDFQLLYERVHEELTLQQTKRDQIISLYLALVSFLIPFAFSVDSLPMQAKGAIFLALGMVGVMFASIIVRYRVYKEVYWLCCQTVSQLMNYETADINKAVVQHTFYTVLTKKARKFVRKTKRGQMDHRLFFCKNVNSAETLHYVIHSLVVTVIFSLGVAVMLPVELWIAAVVGAAAGAVLFVCLLVNYFAKCEEVYRVAIDGQDASFNKAFDKAWFLHFYLDN